MSEMSTKNIVNIARDCHFFCSLRFKFQCLMMFRNVYNVLTITFVCLGLSGMEWTAHVTYLEFCQSCSGILE